MTANSYTGIVEHGSKRAAGLGYPTINISLKAGGGENASGIFAARVFVDGKTYPAAAFADPSRNILEAHLLDFSGDLYGKEVTIELLQKIRDSKKYDDDAALKAAIAEDVAKAREYIKD